MSQQIIENTKEAKAVFGYGHGWDEYVLTRGDIGALLEGKCLAINDGEYTTFIYLRPEEVVEESVSEKD